LTSPEPGTQPSARPAMFVAIRDRGISSGAFPRGPRLEFCASQSGVAQEEFFYDRSQAILVVGSRDCCGTIDQCLWWRIKHYPTTTGAGGLCGSCPAGIVIRHARKRELTRFDRNLTTAQLQWQCERRDQRSPFRCHYFAGISVPSWRGCYSVGDILSSEFGHAGARESDFYRHERNSKSYGRSDDVD
jgi:hypothetical protein